MEFQSGYERNVETIPVGELGIIALKSCETLGKKIDAHIVKWRKEREHEHLGTPELRSYARDSYLIDASVPRFGSGEAKGSSTIPSAAMTCTCWLTSATTA